MTMEDSYMLVVSRTLDPHCEVADLNDTIIRIKTFPPFCDDTMRLSILLSSLPLALGAPQPSGRNAPAPLLRSRDVNSRIAGAYIVKFKDDSALAQLDNVAKSPSLGVNIAPDHIFSGIFNGFSANLDKETLDVIRDHPDVRDYVLAERIS